MKNIVYGLRDPRNDVYQYIGKSTVGNERALQHLTLSHSDRVNGWVKMLADNWLYPQIDIIEEVENIENLPEREKFWINYHHNLNPNLLNIQSITPIVKTRTSEDDEIFTTIQNHIFDIPRILSNERKYRKLSQEEMAKHMGVARSTVSIIERGGNVNFNHVQKYFLTLKGFDILTKVDSQRVKNKR